MFVNTLTPLEWDGGRGQFEIIFCEEINEMLRSTRKSHGSKLPPHGMEIGVRGPIYKKSQ